MSLCKVYVNFDFLFFSFVFIQNFSESFDFSLLYNTSLFYLPKLTSS